MGCDIHCYAEVYKGNKWYKVGNRFKNPWYRPGETDKWNHEFTDQPYDGRNYDLFAILANVRNGYGFAGCDTGDGFKPMALPKGLPVDVTKAVKKISDDWGEDGHSHSWFYLSELMEYDWKGQKSIHRALIDLKDYTKFKKGDFNISMSGGVWGQNVITLTPEQADTLLEEMTFEEAHERFPNKYWYVQVSYEETYYDSAKNFVDVTIPALKELGHPDNVRIVFWFDN